jgi:hypothetical protein
MHDQYSEEEHFSVEELIDAQRTLSLSRNPFERVVGALCVAGLLKQRLAELPNTAIGHLMFDHVWSELNLLAPAMTICQVATERLLSSSPVVTTEKENVNQ